MLAGDGGLRGAVFDRQDEQERHISSSRKYSSSIVIQAIQVVYSSSRVVRSKWLICTSTGEAPMAVETGLQYGKICLSLLEDG